MHLPVPYQLMFKLILRKSSYIYEIIMQLNPLKSNRLGPNKIIQIMSNTNYSDGITLFVTKWGSHTYELNEDPN